MLCENLSKTLSIFLSLLSQPKRDIIQTREGHIWRADHNRYEPVTKTANQRGHHHKENHDQAVCGNPHIPHLPVSNKLQAGHMKFGAHQH